MSEKQIATNDPIPPKNIGRQFVSCYYTLMNKSPESVHNLYSGDAHFCHASLDPVERVTNSVSGKMAIRDLILERKEKFHHTCTRVTTVDTCKTLDDGLIIQLLGEISFNEMPYRSFSQTFFLIQKTPFKYLLQNDIFQFNDYMECNSSQYDESILSTEDQLNGCNVENTNTSFDDVQNQQTTIKEELKNHSISENPELENSIIMDMQSINLKNALLETRAITKENIMKRVPTPENGFKTIHDEHDDSMKNESISENHNQLFQDTCILTIGNVINPNIEFDDDAKSTVEQNSRHNDEEMQRKLKILKRKDSNRKRKEKRRQSRTKFFEQNDETMITEHSTTQNNQIQSKSIEPIKSWADETDEDDVTTHSKQNDENVSAQLLSKNNKASNEQKCETLPMAPPPPPPSQKPKTFADLVKKEKPGQNGEWQDDWKNESNDRRASEVFNRSNKFSSNLSRRSHGEKQTSPKDSYQNRRSSSNGDILQVFVGNIPHEANEEDIRSIFGQFGHIRRFRMHTNPRSSRIPFYAFIVYENIQSVQKCLAKRNSFYWPENSKNGQKLNVNGDASLMVDLDGRQQISPPTKNESVTYKKSVKSIGTDTADLKNFHKNFHLAEPTESDTSNQQQTTKTNLADVVSTVKNERKNVRNTSTRA